MPTLVDSNVLIDVLEDDAVWADWSASALAAARRDGPLIINAIIYSEISVTFRSVEELEWPLALLQVDPVALPWEAAFLAGKAYVEYRRRGGSRRSPLPDFYIGAHAAVAGLTLLTRDATRYRSYFPRLIIIAPN